MEANIGKKRGGGHRAGVPSNTGVKGRTAESAKCEGEKTQTEITSDPEKMVLRGGGSQDLGSGVGHRGTCGKEGKAEKRGEIQDHNALVRGKLEVTYRITFPEGT